MGISEREKKYDNDIWVEEAWIGEESKQVNSSYLEKNALHTGTCSLVLNVGDVSLVIPEIPGAWSAKIEWRLRISAST